MNDGIGITGKSVARYVRSAPDKLVELADKECRLFGRWTSKDDYQTSDFIAQPIDCA
jgi:hypothetical protein